MQFSQLRIARGLCPAESVVVGIDRLYNYVVVHAKAIFLGRGLCHCNIVSRSVICMNCGAIYVKSSLMYMSTENISCM